MKSRKLRFKIKSIQRDDNFVWPDFDLKLDKKLRFQKDDNFVGLDLDLKLEKNRLSAVWRDDSYDWPDIDLNFDYN